MTLTASKIVLAVAVAIAATSPVAAKDCTSIFCDFFSNSAPPTDDGSECLTLCRLTGVGGRDDQAKDHQGAERVRPRED